ncbi:hypothetical protein AU197_07440 [Mycobacterium sp. IS-1590]|nr:hypothetical protein AU197_07440 [Mycobacterium sp. IS-1590]
MHVTSTNNRARRIVAAGAFAVAAVAAPLAASVLSESDAAPPLSQCLAWFGNKEDGRCLGVSNGNGINVGTPDIGLNQGQAGVNTGPLVPGQTITDPYR